MFMYTYQRSKVTWKLFLSSVLPLVVNGGGGGVFIMFIGTLTHFAGHACQKVRGGKLVKVKKQQQQGYSALQVIGTPWVTSSTKARARLIFILRGCAGLLTLPHLRGSSPAWIRRFMPEHSFALSPAKHISPASRWSPHPVKSCKISRITTLMGNCIPNQKWACFVLYLKIINNFLRNNIRIL